MKTVSAERDSVSKPLNGFADTDTKTNTDN
jgi:hypothetical protein